MLIYTGQTTGTKLDRIESLKMGICISSTPHRNPSKDFRKVPCFLDNGAFTCWTKGYPFQEEIFFKTMADAYKHGIKLDFVVCPDIVTGGKRSLDFSLEYASGKLKTCSNLALAVQDGMEPRDLVKYHYDMFKYIFVGGSREWKWKTAESWVKLAHERGKLCHIGRVGTLDLLKTAYSIGADSVDSTNFTRNDSWEVVKEFNKWASV